MSKRPIGDILVSVIQLVSGCYGSVLAIQLLSVMNQLERPELDHLESGHLVGSIQLGISTSLILAGALLFKGGRHIRKLHLFFAPVIALILVNNLGGFFEWMYLSRIPVLSEMNQLVLTGLLSLGITLAYILYFSGALVGIKSKVKQ